MFLVYNEFYQDNGFNFNQEVIKLKVWKVRNVVEIESLKQFLKLII